MIQIREANKSDAEAIHRLGGSVTEFSVSDETVNFWPQDVLIAAIKSDSVIVLVSEDQEQLVGFLIASCNQPLRKALIENIYVIPEQRGHDVGGRMLARLVELLTARGYSYIATLAPPEAGEALHLYERSGFTKGNQFLWLDKPLTDEFKAD